MSVKTTAIQPLTAIRRLPAIVALGAGAFFVVLLVLLHILRPDLDPSWRFISEYAVGRFGYLMIIAFLSLSAGYVSLFLAIWSQVPSIWGKVGLIVLVVGAAGMLSRDSSSPIRSPRPQRNEA